MRRLRILIGFLAGSAAISGALAATSLPPEVDHALEYFRKEQMADGSFTKLTVVSSPLYATHMIFLYEYLGLTHAKQDRIDRLMQAIWSRQNADGGFAGYAGGESNIDISASVYLAARIAGEPESSERLQKLESSVKSMGGLGMASKAVVPYLMVFGLDKLSNCVPGLTSEAMLKLDHELPWERVMAYPFLWLVENHKTHPLSPEQVPALKTRGFSCPNFTPHPNQNFFKWLLARMGTDGTFFDFTPTTVPALMALSTQGDRYRDEVELGLNTLESFQDEVPGGGLLQSPGEASIGETFVVLNGMLEMGASPNDSIVLGAEKFLLSVQQKNGGFGFSKHNQYYADSDDTSNAVYALKKLSILRGETEKSNPELTARLSRAMTWLLSIQNSDGGFGTWDRETLLAKVMRKMLNPRNEGSLVFSESVVEHSARIVQNLSLFKNDDPTYARAYDRGIQWLLKKQNADGSYSGAWFIDYLFGTAMVTSALGTASDRPEVNAAIEKALAFILAHQRPDGGFSESPESFVQKQSVPLPGASSPAQTGLIVTQLMTFLEQEHYAHLALLEPSLDRATQFLKETQASDGLWHDLTWTGVTFPKLEYSIYPYVQEMSPLQAIGMYQKVSGTFW